MSQEQKTGPKSHTGRTILGNTVATVSVLIALVVAIGANLVTHELSSRYSMRVDMTTNKIYTLDPVSRKVVQDLKEPMVIKVFVSPDMPPPFHNITQSIGDVLDEYVSISNGNVTYQLITPGDKDANEEAAKGYGCERVSIGKRDKNEVSLRAVYKCLAFVMGEKQSVIKDLALTGDPRTDNLEYTITKSMLNLTTSTVRKVGFVRGFGGPAQAEQFVESTEPVFQHLYGDLIKPVGIDMTDPKATIDEDVVALIIMDLELTISDRAIFMIDQFVQRGGSVAWVQSPTTIDLDKTQQVLKQRKGTNPADIPRFRMEAPHGLGPLFKTWGIDYKGGVVLDRENAVVGMVRTQQGMAPINHPATFQITNLDRTMPFLAKSPPLSLPGPARLEVVAKNSDTLKAKAVITSAASSTWRPTYPGSLRYEELQKPSEDEKQGEYVLGATLEGRVPSFYRDNPLPEGFTEADLYKGSGGSSRILVLSSGAFIQRDDELGFGPQLLPIGQQLFFDVIEWLAQDSSLSGIRTKHAPRFVGEVTTDAKKRIQFINIIFVPGCFALIGVFMYLRRQRRRGLFKLDD